MKVTAIDEVTLAVVTAIRAGVTYPVFDGPPSKLPSGPKQYKWLAIGVDVLNDQSGPATAAVMDQVWSGLGEPSRAEEMHIHCVAVGRADSIANARALAMAVIQDVGTYLPKHPTPESYNALISAVSAVRPHNMAGGALVHVEFTISASARLV
jgi:hypothetical protein